MIAGLQRRVRSGASCATRQTVRAFDVPAGARDAPLRDVGGILVTDPAEAADADTAFPSGEEFLHAYLWDGVVPLRHSAIKRRLPWLDGLSREVLYGRLTHCVAAAAFVALAAAFGSAVKSFPGADSSASLADRAGGEIVVAPARAKVTLQVPSTPIVLEPSTTDSAPARADDTKLGAIPPVNGLAGLPSTRRQMTQLVAFDSAPFPYNGLKPGGSAFLDVEQGGQKGHRSWRGPILWESTTFNDRRVLVHIPNGFNPDRPAVLVVFYHGYGATLTRDVLARQQVPAQISASGANAVLLAPQFAVDARDSSSGRFWEPGGFTRFLSEAAKKLARMRGDPASERTFAKMPVVLVAYSGGFLAASWSLNDVASTNRVRGILLLDAAYGELERFADWFTKHRSSFFVSGYTRYTQPMNAEMEHLLAQRGIGYSTKMAGTLTHGGAIFVGSGPETNHQDYVTQAWTTNPIQDVLTRLPELRLGDPQTVASMDRATQ